MNNKLEVRSKAEVTLLIHCCILLKLIGCLNLTDPDPSIRNIKSTDVMASDKKKEC